MKLKVLSQRDAARAVTMAEAIEAVKTAFIQLSEGQAEVPLRANIPVPKQEGSVLIMPSYLRKSGSLGTKIVSVFPKNLEKDVPTIHALIIVIDPETGIPQAVMDGGYLTALRTGAASGLATGLLSRADAQVLAVFGAGVQSRTQLKAVCTVRGIKKVCVYDIEPEKAGRYVTEMKERPEFIGMDFRAVDSPAEAVRGADIICAATTSAQPVFDDQDLKPGVHINGVGSYTPAMQEIPAQTVWRANVIVDSRQAALEEAGDLIIPLEAGQILKSHIQGEIGEVASGKITGRTSEEEVTFFKSVGVAVQDAAVASLVFGRSQELGLGTEVDI